MPPIDKGDFPYIEWLARDYKRRAESSGKWADYVKAHGLANYCVVRDCAADRLDLVYDIEVSWYKGRHPLSADEHRHLIAHHKSLLQSYRDEIKERFSQLETEATKFDMDNVFSEENLGIAQLFCEQVFDRSKSCCQGLIDVSRQIIESSVNHLQRIGLTSSSKFAVVGLGSIAKGEATPYSDLEYAFIVEPGDPEYFEKLAVDSYFRIGNLGETPLKYFDIEELKVAKNDASVVANEACCVPKGIAAGYRIDGLMKKAGNIPTGNGRPDGQSLTLTVDELIDLYKSSAQEPLGEMAGDLSDLLASSVVIYTNEGQTSQLYERFVEARLAYESNKGAMAGDVNEKRWKSFKKDIGDYSFLPDFVRFQPPNNMDIKIKTDIFRYPTLLANNMKMFLGLNCQYSWEVFSHLHSQGVLSYTNYRYLNIVLALSIYMRTSAYVSYGSQTEDLTLVPSLDSSLISKYNVPAALFILFGYLLCPIKQCVTTAVERLPPDIVCLTQATTDIFKEINVSKTDYIQNAEVCYFGGQYHSAKSQLEKLFNAPLRSIPLQKFLQVAGQATEETGYTKKLVELCCYILYYTGSFAAATSYFQWLLTNNPDREDISLLKLLTAHCMHELREFQTSKTLLQEAERHLTEHGKNFHVAGSDHTDTLHSYNNIGIVYAAMGEYRKALGYFTKALRMCVSMYGKYGSVIVSVLYSSIGVVHSGLGNPTLALEYQLKSLDMKKAIYGDTTNHPYIADIYNNIGITYSGLGNHTLALEYHLKSLDMKKAIYGDTTNHPAIAGSYNGIGSAYRGLGNHTLALEYHLKSLDMRKAIYGDSTSHPYIADSYNNIGSAYSDLGNHTLALEYQLKSLDMKKAIYGDTTNHPDIAGSYNNIGSEYSDLGNHTLALE